MKYLPFSRHCKAAKINKTHLMDSLRAEPIVGEMRAHLRNKGDAQGAGGIAASMFCIVMTGVLIHSLTRQYILKWYRPCLV